MWCEESQSLRLRCDRGDAICCDSVEWSLSGDGDAGDDSSWDCMLKVVESHVVVFCVLLVVDREN